MSDKFFIRYDWSGFTDGGYVSPDWTWLPTGKPHITGCCLYSPTKAYIGYWHGENMPLDFKRWLAKEVATRIPYPGKNDGGQMAY